MELTAPIQDDPHAIVEMASLLADAHADTPVGAFFKVLSEDDSGNCPVCYSALPELNDGGAQNVRPSTSPFCTQGCRELAVCMCIMLDGALQSKAHEVIMLHLRDTLAQKALNIMQKIADKSSQHQRPLRRLLINLATACNQLPQSLFLKGVRLLTGSGDRLVAGGFSDVHRGRYNHQDVALKVLRIFSNTDEATRNDLKQKLQYEALLWRNLSHRHVLPFFGIDNHIFHRSPCMVSPYMRNGNVRHKAEGLIKRGYSPDDLYYLHYLFKWMHEIAQGLAYLHREGIVHDFGLSVLSEAQSRENNSARGGNERWMAPEQLNPELFGTTSNRPTTASDVFSVGCVCIELYTAQKPYIGLSDYQVIDGVPKNRRPQRTNVVNNIERTVPGELWRIAEKCWEHLPENRPSIQWVVEATGELQVPDDWLQASSSARSVASRSASLAS
ncbi:unnamed protein product [Somion occarium]|uniref:Protein kinase domain-containing protein n=1 Tax=Somion occarium TaxID=3059160 RepID=A0ABP1EBB0_9APHY